MAEENLKDFTINWVIVGLLLFCLISFTTMFMYNNNPIGLNDGTGEVFSQTNQNLTSKLYRVQQDSDKVLNITANTNPEASDLGSRDSVASSYSAQGTSMGFFDSMKVFISWVFVGEIGQMLIVVFSGIIGFTAFFLIYKWIRNGI